MREQPVEHAVDKQAAVAEEAPLDHPGKKSAGAGSNDDRNGDSDFLFMNNVDRGVTHERMVKERKEAATSTIKVKQANKSLKAMESNQESSLLSPTEDSICPPLEKRQKKLSDKDGEEFDAHSPARASQTALYMHDKGDGAEDERGKKLVYSIGPKRPRHIPIPIEAYTAQCDTCKKWRLVPTKKKYEELRERTEEDPFTCEKAREWKPDVACGDPSEVSQDGSRIWAMEQHKIPQAPLGWERLITIRSERCTKFADVYYISPAGKKLKSINEVDNYLKENPQYDVQGVKLSQFSFKIPAPAQPDYVRKRTRKSRNDGSKPLLEEVSVQRITREAPATPEGPGAINQLVPLKKTRLNCCDTAAGAR